MFINSFLRILFPKIIHSLIYIIRYIYVHVYKQLKQLKTKKNIKIPHQIIIYPFDFTFSHPI